jgi:hypothetical protein
MRLQKLEYRAYVLALTAAVSGLPPAFAAAAPPESRGETAAAGGSLAVALQRLNDAARVARS